MAYSCCRAAVLGRSTGRLSRATFRLMVNDMEMIPSAKPLDLQEGSLSMVAMFQEMAVDGVFAVRLL